MKKIAIIGIRGIPVIYSGFESFVENLIEFIPKKFAFTVYCRASYVNFKRKKYKGATLLSLPSIPKKNIESLHHGFLATIHACFFLRPDIIYFLGVGNAPYIFLAKLCRIKTIINVDGLDWKREKWNFLIKAYLRFSEVIASIFADHVITDSQYMKDYYLKVYKKQTIFIPYFFNRALLGNLTNDPNVLKTYKLIKKKYFVWVGRIVPDNHLDELIYAFKNIKTNLKCVIIGDDPYSSEYKNKLLFETRTDKRFIFTGFVNKKIYTALLKNAYIYIETKRSGGTHPSLIEAKGFKCVIICNDFEPNKQVLRDNAIFYSTPNNLLNLLKVAAKGDALFDRLRKKTKRIPQSFSPQFVIKQYENIFA